MAVQLMTVSEYARHRGCDEKAVRKAIEAGRISVIEKDGKRWIDPAVADIQWAQNTRARARTAPAADQPSPPVSAAQPKGGQGTQPGMMAGVLGETYLSYDQARTARENEELLMARITRQEKEGSLTDAAAVGQAVWTAFRMLRDSMMPLGRTVAGRLVPLTDQREIQQVIDEGMRQALNLFRDRVLAKLAAEHAHAEGAQVPADLRGDASGGD